MPDVTLITPTADQPTGMLLCEKWMLRQTLWKKLDIQWIVADDGNQRADLHLGQTHLYHKYAKARPPGYYSLIENMSRALPRVDSPLVFIIEHDDWYAPTHLEAYLDLFNKHPNHLAVGDPIQRYYHVGRKLWRKLKNVGACFSQTSLRQAAIPLLWRALGEAECRRSYGIDRFFWNRILARRVELLPRTNTVVGIKGLPGIKGLGEGHRPARGWGSDPQLDVLQRWVRDDITHYKPFCQ